jgi:hypothetical protein
METSMEKVDKVDHVQVLQDYIISSDLTAAQLFALFERLEPIFQQMYDLGLTKVMPVRDMRPVDEMFNDQEFNSF